LLFQVKGTHVYFIASFHRLPIDNYYLPAAVWSAYQQSKICIFEDNPLTGLHPCPPMKSDQNVYYPWAQALLLSTKLAESLGFVVSCCVDSQLLRESIEDKKTLDYLDIENVCNVFASAPIEEQNLFLDLVTNHSDKYIENLRRHYTAWRNWDVETLTEMLNLNFTLFPEMYRHLITLRNQLWCPKIVSTISSGDPAIIVAGASHFIGTEGICQLTMNHGYDLLEIPLDL